MMAAQEAFADRGLDFTRQAVAITGVGSELDGMAEAQGWLHRFPMWDWVGGRTSITSAVGLVPMALQGLDIRAFLEGAAAMDRLTRAADTDRNPAARLALMWHFATGGRGARQMVVLPYKDRLLLLSRYLQQLVMESLGKERDLEGNVVEQGLTVYGNKGSTDQHAFVQQLRDGLDDFFVTFVTVQQDTFGRRPRAATEVEPDVTSGDYLMGFWQGTRQALSEKGRGSITLTLDRLDARTLGGLIALYERAVGLYASLVNINAYHQPGVEAGKKAAGRVIDLQQRAVQHLREHRDQAVAVEDLARQIGEPDAIESLYHAMEHLVANRREIRRVRSRYQWRD
jgi:glucose-6-phosphate isomerase